MPSCPSCDAPLPDGGRACLDCGTPASFSFDRARGTEGQANRTTATARKEVAQLRATGVDPLVAERLLDKADAGIRAGQHAPAYHYAQAARRAVTIARTRARLQGELARAEEAVRLAKGSGADTAAAETALQAAAGALHEGRLKVVPTWLRKASVRALEETKVRSAESVVAGAEKAVRYAKERGADAAVAEQELGRAKEALRAKAFDAAREAAGKARDAAEHTRKFARYEKFVAGAEREIEAARKTGANLAEARGILTGARHALKDGLFADAQTRAASVKGAVAEAKRYRAAEVILERAERAARKEERKGIPMGGPGVVLVEAHQALDAREYVRVRTLAKDAREAVKDAVIARRLQGVLTHLAQDAQELRAIGADAAEAESLLKEATAALETQDFDRCRRLASRSRRAADDARDERRGEILIETVQKIIAAAGGHVDGAQVRNLIQDIEAMLAGGEAVDVDALVKARLTVVDAERLKAATKRLGEVQNLLVELKRAEIDVAGSDDTLALAESALDEGHFDEAEQQLAQLEEVASTLVDTLRESAVETMQKAEEAAEKARKAGIPIPDAVRMLSSAKAAMDAGKVYEALEFARIAQARAESAWKKHFEEEAKRDVEQMRAIAERVTRSRERIDALSWDVEDLTGFGIDVQPARDSLGNAQKALAEKRVDDLEAHVIATEQIVEGIRSSLKRSVDDSLERLRKTVAEARAQNLMTPEMEAVFLRAETAAREGQLRDAMDAIKALEETVERAKEEHAAEAQRKEMERAKKASDRLLRVKRMVEELKKANIDIAGADDVLLRAEKAFQGRDYEAVDALLGDLEETAREMRAELVAATRFLVGKAKEAVDAGERLGVDVSEPRALLEGAEQFLAKGKLDDAVESANTAKQKVDALLRLKSEEEVRTERLRIETARQKIDRLKLIVEDLRRADITIDGADDALAKAEEALAAKRYETVHLVLADTETLAESLQEGLRTAAQNLLEKSRGDVEAVRKMGLEVHRADMVLTNAAEAIRDGRYVEAIEYHKVIDDIVDDARRLHSYRELEAEVGILRSDLARMAAMGGDTRTTEELLRKAQEEVALGRFDKVAEVAELARGQLALTRQQILAARLDRARIAIGKAQLLGADVSEAEALLPDAEKAVAEGNFEALEVLARRIEEKAAGVRDSFLAAKAEEDFLAVEELAKQVRASGIDVPEAAHFLEEARALKEERKFDSMAEVIAEARRILEGSSRDRVVGEHRKKIRGLVAMLETARQIGANVSEVEQLLGRAEQAIESDDLALADLLVKQAEVSTGVQIQSFIQNKYPNLTVRMPAVGLQANTWNRFTMEVANKGTLGAKNIDLKIEGDVEVRGLQPIPELGVDETKAIEVGVRPTRDGDVPLDVRVSYERYFDENKYEASDRRQLKVESPGTYLVEDVFLIHSDGRLIAHESRKFRQEIDEDIFSGMLTVVQDFIRDSFKQRTSTGIKRLDFGQSKILIERSEHCFLTCVVLGTEPALLPLYMAEVLREIERTYGDALGTWSGMLHELAGIEEAIRKLLLATEAAAANRGELGGLEVAEVERLLTQAKETGAETSEVEALLAKAASSLETDMDLAWELLSKAKVQVKESQEKYLERMKRLVDETADAVEQLRRVGVDAGPSEILLKEAREAFEAGRYDKVEEIATNVRGILERAQEESIAKRVEADLTALIQDIEKARGEGIDVTRAEALLVRIEDALQKKNFRAVEEHMRRARESLKEERRRTILRSAQGDLERLSRMLVEAKGLGAESAEAEGLLLRAREALADGRADDLDAIVRQADAVARREVGTFLEDRHPRLFLATPTTGLQADAWNRLTIELTNKGNLVARDVDVSFTGDAEVRGLKPIPRIEPNEKKRIEVGVRPRATGATNVDLEVRYRRPLDDRQYQLADSRQIRSERAGTYLVEDAFLIHKDGRLIDHETRSFREGPDEDIFSGMLTAILNYVKASFNRAEEGLRRLDFGAGGKILFERSPNTFLAAFVTGGEPLVLPIYMVDVLQEAEDRFGPRLANWTGLATDLPGVENLVRRLLYVTGVEGADLGPLADSTLLETLRLVAQESPEETGADFVAEARTVIESKDFEEASEFVRKAIQSYTAGREELHQQLREAVITHGEMTGLQLTDEQMKAYIDVVRRVVDAVFGAREKAGLDKVWPVKRVAVKVDDPLALDAVTSFRKIIVNQAGAKELDIVAPGETWRGLSLTLNLDSEAIARAYRLWAKKIEILLRSQDAWKIKQGIDKGEYHLGVEGQKVRIDPSMVWFTETVPDNVVEQPLEGGRVYVDTAMTEDILAEGYAKELVHIIRDVRRDLKLPTEIWIETRVRASETLNKLLRNWRDFISKETNTQALKFVRGDLTEGYVVECNLGTESFSVSVKPVEGVVANGEQAF